MTTPTQTGPRLTPTSVAGVWHTPDHRFLTGPFPHLDVWALDYWPTGLYTPGHSGPVRITADNLAHAQQLIDWICWAETQGTYP